MPSRHFTSRQGGVLALLICTLIWGFAFSAQTMGMEHLGPVGFNALRFLIGGISLIPCIALLDLLEKRRPSIWGNATDWKSRKTLVVGGAVCGIVLGLASVLQQTGLLYASVGKAGFLTALYIIIVPILGIPLGHKVTPVVWLATVLALLGMALLCNLTFDSGMNKGDYWLLACAFAFSVQILLVAHYVSMTDCVRLSCVQFFGASIVSFMIFPFTKETIAYDAVGQCVWPLLFCGVLSSGCAYTLQNVGEKYVHPVVATLLMSLEAVFSTLGGWIILHQNLTNKEYLGCGIIFVAIILAQIPMPAKRADSN